MRTPQTSPISDEGLMQGLGKFHDGSLNGLLVENTTVYIFVTTYQRQRYVFIARGLLTLAANELREGSSIFEVSVRSASEIDEEELKARSQEHPPHSAGCVDGQQLNRARQQNLKVLTIDPSYGATCLIFAESFEKVTYADWKSRLL